MPQPYATVELFFRNADAHAAFLARVTARLVEWAIAAREAEPPDPVTGAYAARQDFACQVLRGKDAALAKGRAILPALAIKANDAGLIDEDGTITATDAQILNTIDDAFIDLHAGYIPTP
jgi:hypothetical protein